MLPQKRYYRQRAHSNPICDHVFDNPLNPAAMDWSLHYPDADAEDKSQDNDCNAEASNFPQPAKKLKSSQDQQQLVEFLDVGCGYGGLLISLSPLFPDTRMLGFEIRVKVSQYVKDRIQALRILHPGQYQNVACIRTNAMKYLPNYFYKGQLKKMFFLYPDPHFKRSKHKWRIISDTLLAEYAYFLAVGGMVYTVTDVKDLHDWMVKHLSEHPLFEVIPDEELKDDPVTKVIADCTEEGQKVTRNNGDKFIKVFRRVADGHKAWSISDNYGRNTETEVEEGTGIDSGGDGDGDEKMEAKSS